MTLKLLFLFVLPPLLAAGALAAAPAQAAATQAGVAQSPDCVLRAKWPVALGDSVDQIARTEDGRLITHIEPGEIILTSDPAARATPTSESETERPEPRASEPPATTAPAAPITEANPVEAARNGLPVAVVATAAALLLALGAAVLAWRSRRRHTGSSGEIEADVEIDPREELAFIVLDVVRTSAGFVLPDGWELADVGPVERELSKLPEGESRSLRFLARLASRRVHLAARRDVLYLDRPGTPADSQAERRATVARTPPAGDVRWTRLLRPAPRTLGTRTQRWRSLWLAVSPLSHAVLVNVRGAAIQHQGAAFLFRGAEVRRPGERPDVAVVRILAPATPEPPAQRRRLAELRGRLVPHVSATHRLRVQQTAAAAVTPSGSGDLATMVRIAIWDAAIAIPLIAAAVWFGSLALAALALPWVARAATFPSGLAMRTGLHADSNQPGPDRNALEHWSWLRWGMAAFAAAVGVAVACLFWPTATTVDRLAALVAVAVAVELGLSLRHTRAELLAGDAAHDRRSASVHGVGTTSEGGQAERDRVSVRLVRGARRVLKFLAGHDDDGRGDLVAEAKNDPLVRRFAWRAAVVFIVTGLVQLAAGWITAIASLRTDAFHSLVDALEVTPILVAGPLIGFIALRRGREPDPERADAWATLFIVFVFMALTSGTAIGLGVKQLVAPEASEGDWRLAAFGIGAGFVGNFIAWRIRRRGAILTKSKALGASATHAALDMGTSAVVAFALFGPLVDGIASLVIGAIVGLAMWGLARPAYQQLRESRTART